MIYTVGNSTATSATLPNLQCNTEYTIWVEARGSRTGRRRSSSRTVSLPARGMYLWCIILIQFTVVYHLSHSHSHWGHYSVYKCLKCQGHMAVDQFRPSSRLLQHHLCDLLSWGRWWVLLAAQWPSSNWGYSHWPPVQHKLHHHCSGHCWRTQEGGCSPIFYNTRYILFSYLEVYNVYQSLMDTEPGSLDIFNKCFVCTGTSSMCQKVSGNVLLTLVVLETTLYICN